MVLKVALNGSQRARGAGKLREQLGEVVTALVLLGLWAVVWTLVQDFPEQAQRYPRFILLCLFTLSTIHLLQAGWRLVRPPEKRRTPPQPAEDATIAPAGGGRVVETARQLDVGATLTLTSATIVYVLAIPYIGFLVSTCVFLVTMVCSAIGWTPNRVLGLIVVLLLVYGLVVFLFGLRLPAGLLI